MQLIKCTKKLQKEMGLKPSNLAKSEPTFSYLGSWHANLIFINRKKCILFCNDKTLFNFIVPDITKKQIQNLEVLFKEHLSCVLSAEGFPNSTLSKIMSEYESIGYSNTSNKSVLGSMNDLVFHYKDAILDAGGVHSYLVPSIISQLNHMPMGAIDYAYSIEALKALYQNTT